MRVGSVMGRGNIGGVVVAAVAVALLVVSATWLTTVGARPSKPPVPLANGTLTALYTAEVMCAGGDKFETGLTLVYKNGKLVRAVLGDYELPLAVFKYPHQFATLGSYY